MWRRSLPRWLSSRMRGSVIAFTMNITSTAACCRHMHPRFLENSWGSASWWSASIVRKIEILRSLRHSASSSEETLLLEMLRASKATAILELIEHDLKITCMYIYMYVIWYCTMLYYLNNRDTGVHRIRSLTEP